mmetsp:Transcript_41630/g.114815  ORF Transcript_41630/g.114815 Transcript_41630/m.114815 type:complete len:347 (-) Transcript_41630:80-1120(-)
MRSGRLSSPSSTKSRMGRFLGVQFWRGLGFQQLTESPRRARLCRQRRRARHQQAPWRQPRRPPRRMARPVPRPQWPPLRRGHPLSGQRLRHSRRRHRRSMHRLRPLRSHQCHRRHQRCQRPCRPACQWLPLPLRRQACQLRRQPQRWELFPHRRLRCQLRHPSWRRKPPSPLQDSAPPRLPRRRPAWSCHPPRRHACLSRRRRASRRPPHCLAHRHFPAPRHHPHSAPPLLCQELRRSLVPRRPLESPPRGALWVGPCPQRPRRWRSHSFRQARQYQGDHHWVPSPRLWPSRSFRHPHQGRSLGRSHWVRRQSLAPRLLQRSAPPGALWAGRWLPKLRHWRSRICQ